MAVNKHLPHLIVLPEDDANRQIANGFVLGVDQTRSRSVQVLQPAGGWLKAIETFKQDQVAELHKYENRFLALLIDFDDDLSRGSQPDAISADLRSRVFILGARKDPEELKASGLGTFESIGKSMAEECRRGSGDIWQHPKLSHNAGEVARLSQAVRPFLF